LTGVPDRVIHIQIFNSTVKQRFGVWVGLTDKHLQRCQRHQLNLNSFDFHVDAEGDEYATINHETQQTNIQGGLMCEEAPGSGTKAVSCVDFAAFRLLT
jgi:hypothetical protein